MRPLETGWIHVYEQMSYISADCWKNRVDHSEVISPDTILLWHSRAPTKWEEGPRTKDVTPRCPVGTIGKPIMNLSEGVSAFLLPSISVNIFFIGTVPKTCL